MSDDAITQRVEGRHLAVELLSVLDGETFTEHKLRGFWDEMLGQCPWPPVTPEKSTLRTMDDESAKRFEQSLIKFGIYSGSQYGVVPIVYLTWVADNAIDLQAYLRSERGKRRIENDD